MFDIKYGNNILPGNMNMFTCTINVLPGYINLLQGNIIIFSISVIAYSIMTEELIMKRVKFPFKFLVKKYTTVVQ